MKLDYNYCLNQGTCLHRCACSRWIGNYTDEEAVFVSENVFDYVDDESCMENLFDLLDRFRLSSGEDISK